jgi:hypothetical protein
MVSEKISKSESLFDLSHLPNWREEWNEE